MKSLSQSEYGELRSLYQQVYVSTDEITVDDLSEEVVEEIFDELVQEYVSEGYEIEEVLDVVEDAALDFIEAKVTYGHDTEAPKAPEKKSMLKGRIRYARRKAGEAVKAGKEKVKTAKAGAEIAGLIAKDEVRRAGRAGKQAVVGAVQKKKEQVKKGVKGLIGRGLRKAADAVGKVASKASTAAARLGEGVENVDEVYKGKHGQSDKEYADSRSPGGKMVSGDSKQSGAEYTHGRRVKAANPGMQPDVGGKTKPKSQGKMDRGTRADLDYRKANLKKEELELDQMIESLIERGHTEKEAYALVAQFTLDEDNVNEIFGLGGKSAKDRLANSDYMKKKNKEADEKAIQNLRDMMSKDPERQKRPSRINNEGYQRNPEKGEKEDKKYAPVRGERTPMPPRGDKRREDFEKWYAAQHR